VCWAGSIDVDAGASRIEGRARSHSTGHRHDPAAERCHYVAPPDDDFGELPDDKSARETRRLRFVLVTLEDAPPR
jgi:hypothetical protein